MKSLHIRDVDPLIIRKIEILARMHHRSVQGELRALLAEAARRVPSDDPFAAGPPVTVAVQETGTWRREELYSDDAR